MGPRPRAGYGVALDNGVRVAGALPGRRQTAQRAEVAALATAIGAATGPLTVVVDNQYVFNRARWMQSGGRPGRLRATGIIGSLFTDASRG